MARRFYCPACRNNWATKRDAGLCCATKVPTIVSGMAKRGYSREFRPHGDTGKRYLLDDIPAGLWSAVREKCKRDGVSIRAQILKLLKEWVSDGKGQD
jgi:hypothetical protein